MIFLFLEQVVSRLRLDKNTLKHGLKLLMNLLFLSSATIFVYKAVNDAIPYYRRDCALDPANACDASDIFSAVYNMLKDKFTDSFYDGMFQATFTYSFVGALNSIEAYIRHIFRNYETNVIGWNILVHDHKTGKIRLEIPTEDTCSIKELMLEDKVLIEKASKAMNSTKKSDKYPDFFIMMNSAADQQEFMRHIVNRVSQSVKSSQWPAYAMARLTSQEHREEKPMVLAVSEKNPGMQSYMMRTWLVFPSVLRELMKYEDKDLTDPNGPFVVDKEHHRIRLQNLRLWAIAEFEKTDDADKMHMSTSIYLPQDPKQQHSCLYSHDGKAGRGTPSKMPSDFGTPSSARRSARLATRITS